MQFCGSKTQARPTGPWLMFACITAGLVSATGCVQARVTPDQTLLPASSVVIPVDTDQNLPIVECTLDGHGPYRFLLDTGSEGIIVTDRIADSGRFEVIPAVGSARVGDKDVRVRRAVRFNEVRIRGATFSGVDAVVLPQLPPVIDADGVLGFPLFAHCTMTLSFAERSLILDTQSLPDPNGQDVLELQKNKMLPQVAVSSGETHFVVLLDTGSQFGLTVDRATSRQLPFAAEPVPGPVSLLIVGGVESYVGRLKKALQVGVFSFDQPTVRISPIEQLSIGNEILKHFQLSFDQQKGVVQLTRVSDEPITFGPIRAVGCHFAPHDDGLLVSYVIPEAPFDKAGVKKGDVLLRLNGTPIKQIDDETRERLNRTGEMVTLTFRREQETIEVTVPAITTLVP